MARSRTAPSLAALGLGLALALSGCDQVADTITGPDPGPAADALAAALAAGDLSQAPLADSAAAQAAYDDVVAGLGEVTPSVVAGEPDEADDRASVKLTWTWPFSAGDWTYTSQAALSRDGDDWVATWEPTLLEPDLAEGQVLDATTLPARRGDIVGARGLKIVTDRPVVRVGIDKTKVSGAKAEASARTLADAVGVDAGAYVKRVKAAGDQAFVEAITLRSDDVGTTLTMLASRTKGVLLVQDEVPLAPTRGFAAPILGSVGEVTAEMVEKDPETYQAGDVAGLSGLQARYDDQLRGTPGVVVDIVPGAASTSEEETEVFRVEPARGSKLVLSMDVDLQQEAESLLTDTGPASAIVALRPSTGAILAAANGPGTGGVNIATYGQAAPGSTFKIVSSLALLRSGLTPSSTVDCPVSFVVDGKTFTNYSDYPAGGNGRIPLRTAVANSCNTAFVSEADRLGKGDLAAAAASLGLGVDHEVGFPAYFGQVPTPETETEAAADMIGQGTILASPMAMAAVIGSVETGGTVVPWLVKGEQDDPPASAAPLTGAEATALRDMLRGVVTSGSGRGLLDVPGAPVIAKTGTAEFDKDGKVLTHAWMVAAQGDLAVAVYVDEGESGSGTAGPILEAFLRAAG